ncbi:MAG: hypothetical protein ACHQFW_01085 [Chitinophagales bacterium]
MKKLTIICFMMTGFITVNAQTGKDTALETLGSLSAFSLYDAYCVIGVMADAFSDDVYEADYVSQIMDEQVTLLTTFNEGMDKLNSSGFITDDADRVYIASAKECADLLTSEAKALKSYTTDPTVANSESFQDVRTKAWAKISALLGIE